MLADKMSMTDTLWLLLGLAAGPLAGAGIVAWIGTRRRAAARTFAATMFTPPIDGELHGVGALLTIDQAEWHLGLLYKRLRAHLRDPYDFETSRMKDKTDFQSCLELAVSLNIRISDLSGAVTPPGEEGREQVRHQILGGLARGTSNQRHRALRPHSSAHTKSDSLSSFTGSGSTASRRAGTMMAR
jgi:hypothetical protein